MNTRFSNIPHLKKIGGLEKRRNSGLVGGYLAPPTIYLMILDGILKEL